MHAHESWRGFLILLFKIRGGSKFQNTLCKSGWSLLYHHPNKPTNNDDNNQNDSSGNDSSSGSDSGSESDDESGNENNQNSSQGQYTDNQYSAQQPLDEDSMNNRTQ